MTSSVAEGISGVNRFQSLWRRCLLDGMPDDSAAIHHRLVAAYNEPQRHYHTLAHIEHCLAMFDQCKSLADNPDALEMSIWFHDAIFEPGNPDNEALSAELYSSHSAGVHTNGLRDLVVRLIMATRHDSSCYEDSDAKYMIDIDLSSFGLSWVDFQRDSQNLRAENPKASDTDYHRRQSEFRSNLLSREKFFYSEYFQQRFEQQAQDNLARYFGDINDLI